MKFLDCSKLKSKLNYLTRRATFVRMDKKTVFFSVFSFIFGFLFNILRSEFVKLGNKGIYFGDSPSYISKNYYPDVFLVILIFSSVNNFSRRETIRKTWLSEVNDSRDIFHVFAISAGSANDRQKIDLQNEQDRHRDLLLFKNLDDSFYLLTTKLLASIGWLTDVEILGVEGESSASRKLRKFSFMLKCDDDSYVRANEISKELKAVFSGKRGENLYWGFFDGRAKPKKSGKYKEDEWKICDYYIPYALGGGYVLAESLVRFIAKNGNDLIKYKSEDISVGAWLSSYSGLQRVHEPRFDTEYISRGCDQSYLITHKHSEMAMKNFYENIKNSNRLCKREFRTRISYNYNWTVPPSKCCARNNPDIP